MGKKIIGNTLIFVFMMGFIVGFNMIFGSVNIAHAAEFIYYLKKYNYQGVVFFDTFPIRENAKLETQANINSFEKISKIIDEIGMDRIAEVVSKRDGVEAQRLVLDMLK